MANSQRYNDRLLGFRYPSLADLRLFLWKPDFPPFDPIFTFEEICGPFCPKINFFKHIKGQNPAYQGIFRPYGANLSALYQDYFNQKKQFETSILNLFNHISWNKNGANLVNENLNSAQWDNILRIVTERDNILIGHLRRILKRLLEQDTLKQYVNQYGNIFFRIQLFNPEIQLPTNKPEYRLALRRNERYPVPYRYTWNEQFPAIGMIPEINFEKREIVKYCFYSREFIKLDPLIEPNFEEYERQMFLYPEMHHLWLIRQALTTLKPKFLNQFNIKFVDEDIFSSNSDDLPSSSEFSNYNLRLETLDESYSYNSLIKQNNVDLSLRTAQSLIILKLIHRRRPNLVLSTEFPCLVDTQRFKFCGYCYVCGHRDYVQYPIPVVTENIRNFQNHLRDEITLESRGWFYLYKFIDYDILELKNYINIWIGTIKKEKGGFEYENDNYFGDFPPIDKNLKCVFWSPFFILNDLNVKLAEEQDKILIKDSIEPQVLMSHNLSSIFDLFSRDNRLNVILGEFPSLNDFLLPRRQQKAIWHACNFSLKQGVGTKKKPVPPNETIEEFEQRVLQHRLSKNDTRAGEAIFGDRVRYLKER